MSNVSRRPSSLSALLIASTAFFSAVAWRTRWSNTAWVISACSSSRQSNVWRPAFFTTGQVHRLRLAQHRWHVCRAAEATDGDGKAEKRGYQFGDLFINKLTGKDKYEFGDVSRFIDGKIKDAVCQVTGKDEYEFGDLSRHLDARAKEQVANFTGKADYEFGDITKELARRVQAEEVDFEDVSLLLRAALSFGVGLTPVAHLLPVQLLLNLLTWNVEVEVGQRVSGRLSTALAEELDRRAKGALLGKGNEDYALGDFTKKQLEQAVCKITGKSSYEFGDISRTVLKSLQEERKA